MGNFWTVQECTYKRLTIKKWGTDSKTEILYVKLRVIDIKGLFQ